MKLMSLYGTPSTWDGPTYLIFFPLMASCISVANHSDPCLSDLTLSPNSCEVGKSTKR